jgi:integrase/recombinase XerC
MEKSIAVRDEKVTALLQAFLSGRNALTMKAYRADLEDFAGFIKTGTIGEAASLLLTQAPGEANGLALAYKGAMVDRKLSAATVNRRLAALRALVKLARVLGLVPWSLEVQNLKAEACRDTKGPGRASLRKVLIELRQHPGPKSKRDVAILRLLHDLGLRRGEVVSLDRGHVDLEAGTLAVLGKGRTGRVKLSLPPETKAALSDWLATRGQEPGPLFKNFDRAEKGSRLTGASIYRLTRSLGLGRPHGLRHLAVTSALDLMGGDVRKVGKFSRHRDLRVLTVYDDARQDLAGEVARVIAAGL